MSETRLARRHAQRGSRARIPSQWDDAPLFVKDGRRYVHVLRKRDALQRIMSTGLEHEPATYVLLTSARTGAVRSTMAHRNSWLYAEDDIDALVQQLNAENAQDQA